MLAPITPHAFHIVEASEALSQHALDGDHRAVNHTQQIGLDDILGLIRRDLSG